MKQHQIKTLRIKAALTQDQLAEKLGVTGHTISDWEKEKTVMKPYQLSAVWKIFMEEIK